MTTSTGYCLDIQGHRGARGLKPENTLPAFAHALMLGVTTLELDCAVTKDGVVVVSHDSTLNPDITRGPDGKWLTGRLLEAFTELSSTLPSSTRSRGILRGSTNVSSNFG